VKPEKKKKIVKTIRIDVDKCNGCRACEVVCSAFHAAPKYGSNNPGRARIRVIHEPLKNIFLPVYAGEYTAAECMGRDKYIIQVGLQGTRFRATTEVRYVRVRSPIGEAPLRPVVSQ